MFTLRYYCRGRGNEIILKLLEEIKEKHGVTCEVLDLWGEEQEKEVYERDFKPRAKILKERTGKSITQLRGAGGERHYYVSIPGTTAIVRNAQVEWWTFMDSEITEFLNRVLSEGRGLLKELCT